MFLSHDLRFDAVRHQYGKPGDRLGPGRCSDHSTLDVYSLTSWIVMMAVPKNLCVGIDVVEKMMKPCCTLGLGFEFCIIVYP